MAAREQAPSTTSIGVANIIYFWWHHITLALWCRGVNALGPVDIVHVGLSLAPTMASPFEYFRCLANGHGPIAGALALGRDLDYTRRWLI